MHHQTLKCLLSLTYPDDKTVTYDYDPLGRMTQVSAWASQVITYTYSSDSRLLRLERSGDLDTSYTYDLARRVLSIEHKMGEELLSSFQYSYDKSGSRLQAVEQLGEDGGAEVPQQPVDFQPSAEGYAAIALQWDDQADNESGYYLDRSTDNQTWQRLAELEADSTSYLDPGLLLHVPYGYRLNAWNASGSSQALTLTATTSFQDAQVIEEPGEVTINPTSVLTITYSYDPLDRLTLADYSTGIFYGYTYDSVGNRLTEELLLVDSSYTYDIANRLTSVNGVSYAWDENGHLLGDGTYTYSYDHANRLVGVSGNGMATSYTYNGLGDRLSQVVDGQTTNFTLDLDTGLMQVLMEGENAYLYGVGRISQEDTQDQQYYLSDALGSVRQLVDASGVTLSKSYEPYGRTVSSSGGGATNYGYTGEWTESSWLVFLRSRYYAPWDGRFLSKDSWVGDYTKPMSYNEWLYAYANPTILTDPSGMAPWCDQYQRSDLTQWLIDEMNENRTGNIFLALWSAVHFPEVISPILTNLPELEIPIELSSYGVAYGLFADAVKPRGLWDFKNNIYNTVGENIKLANNWYTYDVPGNLYFGFIGLAVGFDERILHCGADFATNGKPCSGSDFIEDYEAIEAGYDVFKLSGTGPVDKGMLQTALARHPLIAVGIETEPNIESYLLPWPYPVGTFDDGRSGWIIKHR